MMKNAAATALAVALAFPAVAGNVDGKYKPGKGFSFESADGSAKINLGGRIQARYTYEEFDSDRGSVSSPVEDEGTFTAERVRFHAKGHIFDNWHYKFQADFGKGTSENLKDASLTYKHGSQFAVTMGQFKVGFDHQQRTSSGKQMFVDRSNSARKLGISRDIGVMIHGSAADKRFQWNLGVYNGEGEDRSNPNDGYMAAGRIAFHPNGDYGHSEHDLERTDDHLWLISLGAALNSDRIGTFSSFDTHTDMTSWVFSVGYKHAGFNVQGEYYSRDNDVDCVNCGADSTSAMTIADTSFDSEAWYLQLGYVFAQDWALSGRYGIYDPNTSNLTDSYRWDEETEAMIGVSKYFQGVGHSLKFDADVSFLEEEFVNSNTSGTFKDSYDDTRVRLQLQIVF
ncbi:MAG: porin [Acidobacteriota bacterium]